MALLEEAVRLRLQDEAEERAERRTSTPAPKTSVLRPGWNLAQDPEVVALFREAVRLRFLREAEDREEAHATGSPPAKGGVKKGQTGSRSR